MPPISFWLLADIDGATPPPDCRTRIAWLVGLERVQPVPTQQRCPGFPRRVSHLHALQLQRRAEISGASVSGFHRQLLGRLEVNTDELPRRLAPITSPTSCSSKFCVCFTTWPMSRRYRTSGASVGSVSCRSPRKPLPEAGIWIQTRLFAW